MPIQLMKFVDPFVTYINCVELKYIIQYVNRLRADYLLVKSLIWYWWQLGQTPHWGHHFNKPLNDRIIFTLKILTPNFAISKAKENSRRSQISQKKQKRKTRKSALNNSVIWRRQTIVSSREEDYQDSTNSIDNIFLRRT